MTWLRVTYQIESSAQEIEARAAGVAVEQSVEMPVSAIRHPHVLEEVVGQVESIIPVADNLFNVVIRLAVATTGFGAARGVNGAPTVDVAQLINVLFGNTSLQASVQLVDVEFPQPLLSAFTGPRFGINGLRTLLQVPRRPLTCTAIKPQGIAPADLAALCRTFALGGVDIIKDDHGLADQSYAPFAQRLRVCHAAVDKANRESGLHTFYCPNVTGGPRQIFEQARLAREEGVSMIMVSPMLVGLPVFHELLQEHWQGAVLAHPALAGAVRISPVWLFGQLFRLLGADAVIYPNYGGRFSYSRQLCADLAAAARAPWGHIKPTLPVPAGGMTIERVPDMLNFYGPDTMLLIGGGLLTAGDALLERTRQFVQTVA